MTTRLRCGDKTMKNKQNKNIKVYIILNDYSGKNFKNLYKQITNSDIDSTKVGIEKINGFDFKEIYYDQKSCSLYLKNSTFDTDSSPEDNICNFIDSLKNNANIINNLFILLAKNGITPAQLSDLSKKYSPDSKKDTYIYFWNFGTTYILNKTFFDSGYSVFENNIAHEAINAFKADDKKRYFYLCDSGKLTDFVHKELKKMPNNYIDINKAELINFSKKSEGDKTKYIILQKVSGIEALEFAFKERNNIDYKEIKYNDKSIVDIFSNNVFLSKKSKENTENYPLITFGLTKNSEVKKPKEPIEFYPDSLNNKFQNLTSSSCRQFVMEGSKLFNDFKTLIDDQKWENDDAPTLEEYINKSIETDYEENFLLKIIERDRKETFYSKLLTFTFAHSTEIFEKFLDASKIYPNLEVEKLVGIYNEKYNMDLCLMFEDKKKSKHMLVIENKIDADFTKEGLKKFDSYFKNDKEVKEVQKEFEYYKKEITDPKDENQLTKYYLISHVLAKKEHLKYENIKHIIIAPEYKTEFLKILRTNFITEINILLYHTVL